MSDTTETPQGRMGSLGCMAILLGLAGLGGGTAWFVDRQMSPTLHAGPMVQLPGPGRVAIVWDWEPWGDSMIRWTDGQRTEYVKATEHKDGRCVVELNRLAPGSTFQYELVYSWMIGSKRTLGGKHTVKTPPARGTAFRFMAFGDSGNGGNAQYELAEVMSKQKCDLVIHTGDLIYPSGDARDYPRKFYDPYAKLIAASPFMPSLGNHDCATSKGAPLLEQFMLPDNGPPGVEAERNFWFDYGDARFVALDTNRSVELGAISFEDMKSKVAPWLRNVLTETDARWKFVFFHHPPYTGSTHDAGGQAFVKEAFCGIFDETGVDMVFCGHNHLYERTAPIKADKMVGEGEGPVYITTGAGGASRYPEELPPPDYMRVYNDKVLSFTVVDLTSDKLILRQIDENEKVLDEYSIVKPPTASGTSAATESPAP